MAQIWIRRAYEPASKVDGTRVLVDRLWPRGVKKADLDVVAWTKHLAPSDELRMWFNHDPQKWAEFKRRYFAELDHLSGDGAAELADLRKRATQGRLTLVFGAHEPRYNNAAALRHYLTLGA